jgi:hypothetical protein
MRNLPFTEYTVTEIGSRGDDGGAIRHLAEDQRFANHATNANGRPALF